MSVVAPALRTNRLVAALPIRARQRLLSACEPVELSLADVLSVPGETIQQVYFPTSSFISLTTILDEQLSLEVGLVGDEGMLGTSLLLGVDVSPLHAQVGGAGSALRMEATPFRRAVQENIPLQRCLRRYLYVVMRQLAQTAGCTRFHLVEARLARWLLMMHDRAHSDALHITQEYIAHVLGVRRAGVTHAATALQTRHLIRYSRGHITIVDRPGLEAVSCSCYATDKVAYSRVMK
ncbi:Crp/Fnr family transcriptional regulator [Uliginosibacterium sp. H1]|uniref:Crp/Fnr family transcriptional regulator n=1 Tax=Uliginosibacterium sp. H1 TaxID=3114757 RepID=UPI002E19F37B|nr:Crp/Fnr family transcriptional regulator [Uliginosibacterium sp. H1]